MKVKTTIMKINKEKADKAIATAQRTIDIVKMLTAGKGITEIKNELNCDRQLVEYYHKLIYSK